MTDTQNTKASTVEPGTQINVPSGVVTGGSVTGIAGALIVLILSLRKRWSKDNLELTKDRAETDLIKTYQNTIKNITEQNARLDENAREAWRTRAMDAQKIGELTSKVEHLTKINESQERNIDAMHQRIAALTAMVRHLLPESDRRLFDLGNQQSNQPSEPQNAN